MGYLERRVEELEKLKKMSDDGILDADEFKAAKGKLLK